jgi:hypothetical protein
MCSKSGRTRIGSRTGFRAGRRVFVFNIRAYWPLPPIQDGEWTPPPVCLLELTQIVPALATAA